MASIDKLTVISTDGAGALPRQVTDNLVQTLELLKGATGVDLQQMMARVTESTGSTFAPSSRGSGSTPTGSSVEPVTDEG